VECLFDVPVASVALVIPEEQGALEGTGLTPAGTLDTQMGQALSYTAGPLAAGEPLAFTLVIGPAGGQEGEGDRDWPGDTGGSRGGGLSTVALPGPWPAPDSRPPAGGGHRRAGRGL